MPLNANAKEFIIIPNNDFESGDTQPDHWKNKIYAGDATFSYEKEGRQGGRCVAITSKSGGDATCHLILPIEPQTQYRLSAWIRTENVEPGSGKGALINLHNFQPIQSEAITATTDWTQVSLVFESEDQDEAWINCLFGGWGKSTGKAFYDDFQLEVLSRQVINKKPKAVLHPEKCGAPISKYIYSQFIEHMGRCIYGGIWAEMLEDRKFFYAVDSQESPWKSLEGAGVNMVKEAAYVGDQMPRITLNPEKEHGIQQDALAFKKGEGYTGRLIAACPNGCTALTIAIGYGDTATTSISLKPISNGFQRYDFSFIAEADTDGETTLGSIQINAKGHGVLDIGTLSLMPDSNIDGMRADTLALLKELNAPLYRWPGGNFVSGYDWRDGVGAPDKRPPRKNPAWTGVEHNDFGIHEFMTFCKHLNTEAYIAVNSGMGDVKSAAEEVEYFNGAAETPMGKWRSENGHPKAYQVQWWGIGNEMYGDWQIGHMPLEDYVEKHNRFAQAMRAVDPTIILVGVGATGPWSKTMLSHCANHMDYLSEHFYCGEKSTLRAHIKQPRSAIRAKVKHHKHYHNSIPPLKNKRIPICMDEWNYWYGPHLYGELGTRYFLKDALGITVGLHEFFRSSEWIFMANYAQTVNVIGCIKTTKREAAFATTGLILKLYRQHFGVLPIELSGDFSPLDIAAAWTEDKTAITVSVVNPLQEELPLSLTVEGRGLKGQATCWRLLGGGPDDYNEPGEDASVHVEESVLKLHGEILNIAPLSATLYRIPMP